MKKCRFCGSTLPDEAAFCPYCARSQTEKETVEMPAPKGRKILLLFVVLAAVFCVVFIMVFRAQPKVYDNGSAEAVVTYNDAVWHVLLRNAANDDVHWKTAQETYSRTVRAGTQGAVPLQLYVYEESTQKSAAEEFLAALDYSETAAEAQNGANLMELSNPETNPGFPLAAMVVDVVFDTDCGTNNITWTFHLKNKDTVVLHEKVEINISPELSFSYETTPLETTEQVQALLEQLKTETEDKTTLITITLAPKDYEGDLEISGQAVSLTGSEDENGKTTLHGSLSIDTRDPSFATFENIVFEGGGTGILAAEGFWAVGCSFIGKDTGIEAAEGSWPILADCDFENCGVGLHMNSTTSTMVYAVYDSLSFKNNGTGVFLEKVPGDDVLYFTDCVFADNGTDIENAAGNEIRYSLEGY